MYKTIVLNAKHELAEVPPHMPLDILLALPDYVTESKHEEWIFNLPNAINDLMGGSGWEAATQVMRPYVWANGWNDRQLYQFCARPFGRGKHEFPPVPVAELRANQRRFEIVHFIGNVVMDKDEPALLPSRGVQISYDQIRADLHNSGSRLIILQNPVFVGEFSTEFYYQAASELARMIITDGGPPVLVIADAKEANAVNAYLANFYANIVHNQYLSYAARPAAALEGAIWAELFLGLGGEEILLFSRLRDRLYEQAEEARVAATPMVETYGASEILKDYSPYLHELQYQNYQKRVNDLEQMISTRAAEIIGKTAAIRRDLDFSQESGGAIPLGESSRTMRSVDDELAELNRTYPAAMKELQTKLKEEAQTAPRVLNATFADPDNSAALGPRDPLVAGHEYDFLIDVGPRWSSIKSLVVGSEVFPEKALPPDEQGYPIHVVFISNYTEPKLFSDWLYVPRNTGRSYPYDIVKKLKAKASGPISFRIKAPALPDSAERLAKLHGRLCLYYENNLLQSARVEASIARSADVQLEIENVVDVDYVISGTIQNLDRLATRKLAFKDHDIPKDHPITVNLTLNDDGKEHRILVRQLNGPAANANESSPVGWTPFDADAGRIALGEARDALKACFYLRDETTGAVLLDARGDPKALGLSESPDPEKNNRKTKKQFLWDLYLLAKLGRKLFNQAFGDVRPEGKWNTNAEWTYALQQELATSAIIQVARTGPANYVFPWTLLYQIPLTGPDDQIKFCRVTNEWDETGKRTAGLQTGCPYRNEPWHAENRICPYGFWGLNHIIEQPIPALRMVNGKYVLLDATDKILMGPNNLDLSVSITRDLEPKIIDSHLERLGKIPPYSFSPVNPADDAYQVRSMLREATFAYFLCHGEYDTNKNESYLSIGLRDGNDVHRIYPNTLQNWAAAANMAAWGTKRPLIFINGCHTTNLTPGDVLNFVTAFGFAGASGVIGTEVSVLANVAIEMAESLFTKIAGEMPVGQAMYQARWEMANKGNLLGLAYTLFCLANLHVAKN